MIYSKINIICKIKGTTVVELSEKIGMTKNFYRTMRNKSLRVDTLEKICEVLDVPIEYFFYNEQEFITDGTDLKLLISLYKEFIESIINENHDLNDRDKIISKFENYNALIDLDKYNWTKTKWG